MQERDNEDVINKKKEREECFNEFLGPKSDSDIFSLFKKLF